MERVRILYSRYKKHYSDCEKVSGSYDENTKTIEILIPEGRMKPSGTRGERYSYFRIKVVYEGKEYEIPAKAISYENALKQVKRKYIDEIQIIG